MPSSQFEDEIDDGYEESDDTVPMPEIRQELEYPSSPIAQKSVNSLSLSDAQELAAALSAIALKLGNNDKGVIATLNILLKRSEVLDKEQQEVIAPLLGELKALLTTSQEELKNFNKSSQQSLEAQIKDVILKVDFSPIEEKVKAANTQILESTNELSTKAEVIRNLAQQTQTLGFFASTKYLLVGLFGGVGILYGLFSYREMQIEQKIKSEYDAKWSVMESRFSLLKSQKQSDWNILKMDDKGREYLQLVIRDTGKQVQCGWVDTKQSGMGFPVSFINIPIFK